MWSKLLRLQDSKERTVTCLYVLHPTEETPHGIYSQNHCFHVV